MNLDALKADIANNEIRVLVNGQPETVEYKQWIRRIILPVEFYFHVYITPKQVMEMIDRFSNGEQPTGKVEKSIYTLLDY